MLGKIAKSESKTLSLNIIKPYIPLLNNKKMVGLVGLEPTTNGL